MSQIGRFMPTILRAAPGAPPAARFQLQKFRLRCAFSTLPSEGSFKSKETISTLESTKAMSEASAPLDCESITANEKLTDKKLLKNMEEEWQVKVKFSGDQATNAAAQMHAAADPVLTTPEQRARKAMDSSKAIVKPDAFGGQGAFAACDIKKGELVEYGIARRLPLNGHESPYVFTWSDDRTVWACCGGAAMFYNTHPSNPNTEMTRFFNEDRFEIYALRDIKEGEELTHTYRSLKWRKCFVETLDQE